jgi:hypothetical protein
MVDGKDDGSSLGFDDGLEDGCWDGIMDGPYDGLLSLGVKLGNERLAEVVMLLCQRRKISTYVQADGIASTWWDKRK